MCLIRVIENCCTHSSAAAPRLSLGECGYFSKDPKHFLRCTLHDPVLLGCGTIRTLTDAVTELD